MAVSSQKDDLAIISVLWGEANQVNVINVSKTAGV